MRLCAKLWHMDTNDAPHDWFVKGPEGRITFTETGRKELGSHLARAGISISTVKTEDDYRRAMDQARPYLGDTLVAIARNGKMTMERKALLAIATGDDREASRLIERLHRIRKAGLVAID